MRALARLAVGCLAAVALPAVAAAQEEKVFDPACGVGASCVNGVCMVPAQSAPAAVAPATAPAPPPPQGTGYPPPGYYYPPPGYAYPPAAGAAAGRPERSGFLALPYIGLHSLSGQGLDSLDPGLRLGALLGGSVSGIFSANG